MVFEILIFPKNNETNNTKKKQKYFFDFWARQGLTLVLRILIKDKKSGLRSSLKKNNLENYLKKKRFKFFGGEPDKDWPCSYVSHGGESRIT